MGKVVVNCTNRPPDEEIDCGQYGRLLNMHTYDVPNAEGTIVLGFPLEEGKKLPMATSKEQKATIEQTADPAKSPQEQSGGTGEDKTPSGEKKEDSK